MPDAIHDTVHEMARDEARYGKAFKGLFERYQLEEKPMQINISWDKEACVWIAECEKLGLVLESGSYFIS